MQNAYDEYVMKYAIKHGITVEQAKEHTMVKQYAEWLEEQNADGKIVQEVPEMRKETEEN